MRELILLRHAEAVSADSAADDFQRPLTAHGRDSAIRAAHALAAAHGAPHLIICSPALRTLQTAELLMQTQTLPAALLRTESGIYMATVATLQRLVRHTDNVVARLLLIGHNPGISQLLQTLAPEQGRRGLATAQFATLPLAIADWAGLP